MTNPLATIQDYELFIYSLQAQIPDILSSSLVFRRIGVSIARVSGKIIFRDNYLVQIRELLVFDRIPGIIEGYGYEIFRGPEKLCWYDSQPHPADKVLQCSHPHHKHIPPDIKHNRIPAPLMSFYKPNIPELIMEVQNLLKTVTE